MKAARAILLALLLSWVFPALTACLAPALANVAVTPLGGRVVDQTGTLSRGDVDALNQALRSFEARKGSQIAVLIVPSTDGEAIEQFSLRVAETWKIGRKKIDDGAVLVIAKNDRHLRVEVGYGLEGALTDVTAKRIIDEEITPKFKSGDFAGGVSAGVNRMIRVIDGEKLPAPEPPHWQNTGLFDVSDMFNPFLLIPVFLFGGVMRSMLGRLVGSVVSGGVVTLLAWFLFGSLAAAMIAGVISFVFVLFNDAITPSTTGSRSRGGGWAGGSSGGSWSSGGSSSSGSSDSGGGGGS